MADPIGTTALVVLVPDAEPLIAPWWARHDPAAALRVPAHVTVLYPWQIDPDDDTINALRQLFATHPEFELDFARTARFPGLLYLAPEQPGPLVALTHAVVDRWPEFPPYAGKYGADPTPHLTVRHPVADTDMNAVESELARELPLHTTANAVTLLRFDQPGWSIRQRFPLGVVSA